MPGLARLAWLWKKRHAWSSWHTALAVLALMVPVQVAAIVYRDQTYFGAQGRFLYVVLPVFGVLLATGFLAHFRGTGRAWAAAGLSTAFLLAGIWVLARVVAPAYAAPYPALPERVALYLGDGNVYGQAFVAQEDGLSWVEVRIGTYVGRATAPVTLRLKDGPRATTDIASTTLDSRSIPDNTFARLAFPPQSGSAGREYYLEVDSTETAPTTAAAVWGTYQLAPGAVERYANGWPTGIGSLDFQVGYR